MDSSDGLAICLHTLAQASRVGMRMDRLPYNRRYLERFASENHYRVDELVLYGGEEYEIVGTVPKDKVRRGDGSGQGGGIRAHSHRGDDGESGSVTVDGSHHREERLDSAGLTSRQPAEADFTSLTNFLKTEFTFSSVSDSAKILMIGSVPLGLTSTQVLSSVHILSPSTFSTRCRPASQSFSLSPSPSPDRPGPWSWPGRTAEACSQ